MPPISTRAKPKEHALHTRVPSIPLPATDTNSFPTREKHQESTYAHPPN